MDTTGSDAPLYAWLLRRGYDPRSLRRIETEVERENRELRKKLVAERQARDVKREIERRLFEELRPYAIHAAENLRGKLA